MRQISGWMAAATIVFWGAMGTVILFRALPPEATRFMAEMGVPPAVIITLVTLIFYLRRRAARQRTAASLEEIRRLSRQRLAGEPDEGAYVVLPSRRRHREAPCSQGQERQSVEEDPATPANEHMQADKQNHPANGS